MWEFVERWGGLVVVSVIVLELILSGTWARFYFRHGLVVFRRVFPSIPRIDVPPPAEIQARLRRRFLPSLLVREISQFQYALRERLLEFRVLPYTPVIHGLLTFDPTSGTVEVSGRLNWFTVAFSLVFLGFAMGPGKWIFVAFFILVVGSIYFIQTTQFDRAGAVAAELWSRPYAHPQPESDPTQIA